MKIAYIYTALTSVGGVDRVLTTKANYFADTLSYDVYIITDSQAGRPVVFPLSAKVVHVDLDTDFSEEYRYGLIKRFFCYRRLMKQYKSRLSKTLFEIKPDITISTCGRDLDFLNDIKDGSIKIGESHIAKQYCRNFHLMESKGFPYRQIAKYWRRKQEKAIKRLNKFVVLTQHDAMSWASVRSAEIIPNPFTLSTNNVSDCSSKKIISVGRLNEQKGYERLIEAWSLIVSKHNDWQINIYGNGELYQKLDSLTKSYNISDTFHINEPTDKILEKYCESSFFVMSSRFEGFPLVLLEAMSCGLPCVSFNCPTGPSEIIKNQEDGLLVDNGDVLKLSEAIELLIDNIDERQRMGNNAHRNIQRFSPEIIMNKWDCLFKDVIINR